MNILIACEQSQEVCKAFREQGHRAFSCDIQPCSGGHPQWHIQGDVTPYINGKCSFTTMDGTKHYINDAWDILIAHPPCTFLTVSGNRWFNEEKYGDSALQRYADRLDGINFFFKFVLSNAKCLAIENPIGIMSSVYRKPNQIIQPWMFGHHASKATCLWTRNLPELTPTNIVDPGEEIESGGKMYNTGGNQMNVIDPQTGKILRWNDPKVAKIRSKTYSGIAKAMAQQWGKINQHV